VPVGQSRVERCERNPPRHSWLSVRWLAVVAAALYRQTTSVSHGALGDGPMVLLAAEIRRLREMDKIVGFDWQGQLLARVNAVGQHRVAILDLATGPTRGELHVFARE